MVRLGGAFWEGGLVAVEKGVKLISTDEAEAEESEWSKEVIGTLETLKTVEVADGYAIYSSQMFPLVSLLLSHTVPLQTTRSIFRSCTSFWTELVRYWTCLLLALGTVHIHRHLSSS